METTELNFLNVLKTDLELSDEKTAQVVDFLKKLQKDNSDSLITDIKSLFKEEFHRLDLKMEQQNTKLEQFNTKFEQFDRKLDNHKSDINLKFEQFNTKLEKTKADILKSYLAGLITVVGMILALMATVIFRH